MDTWLPFYYQLIFSRFTPTLIEGCCLPKCNKVFFLHRRCLQLHLVELFRLLNVFEDNMYLFPPKMHQSTKHYFLLIVDCFRVLACRVDQFGITGVPFFVMGVIANVISYYICWAWLIGIHFQIIYFNIYMVQIFVMQKSYKILRAMDFWNWETGV